MDHECSDNVPEWDGSDNNLSSELSEELYELDESDNDDKLGICIANEKASALLNHEYDAEELTYLGTLKESEAAVRLRYHINNSPLLLGAKLALLKIVDTYICRDVILANINNPSCALNDIDIAFSHAILSATTYDTRKPEWLSSQTLIRSTFDILLTRTRGDKRERILQDMQRVEVTTNGNRSTIKQQQLKKRWLGLPWNR